MQAPLQARNDSDAVQTDIARTVAQKRVLTDKRPEAVAQCKLAEMINNSPRMQQLALSDAIHNSPHTVAQRNKMNALFGGAVEPLERGGMLAEASPAHREEKTNKTGLPNQLKSGIESLSGMSMDHVTVHYNSDRPAQLQAHAYAQGSEIHLGAGQERHLPHEAWHVVQQAQGRVRPTLQIKAGAINDDPSLESEADRMGAKAAQFKGGQVARNFAPEERTEGGLTQRVAGFAQRALSDGINQGSRNAKQYEQPLGTPGPAISAREQIPIQRLSDGNIHTLATEISASAPGRSAHEYVLNRIFTTLGQRGISYKVGGSAAAKLLGARRAPNDLELEMPDMASVSSGHGAVNEIATELEIPNPFNTIGTPVFGVQIRFDGAIHNDNSGLDEPVRFEIDMMNENAATMNEQLEIPTVMDVFSGNASREIPNLVERSRLIVNYADRSYNKQGVARAKEDYHQIHDLLAGGDRNALLQEASHHGHARMNFVIASVIRGQNKVSEFVTEAAQNRWFINQAVVPAYANSEDVRIAKETGWLQDDNLVNTRYTQDGW
jgi:hypothetical protein